MPEKRNALALALADPALPQALKDVQQQILPKKDHAAFRELVRTGALDPLHIPEAHPLMSPLSQALSGEEPKKWLEALFSENNAAFLTAKAAVSSYYGQPNIAYYDMDRYKVEQQPLLQRLVGSGEYSLAELLTIAPGVASQLLETQLQKRGEYVAEPLWHHILGVNDCSVAMLDRLEKLTGSDDFLMIRNARGETMFHRIAGQPGYQDNEQYADIASWMLQRRPQLVNDADRFGWTPLDRLISRSSGRADSMMGRLLIVSGAKLAKQIAPGFNLVAALEEHGGHRLDKAPARKLPGPATPAA